MCSFLNTWFFPLFLFLFFNIFSMSAILLSFVKVCTYGEIEILLFHVLPCKHSLRAAAAWPQCLSVFLTHLFYYALDPRLSYLCGAWL